MNYAKLAFVAICMSSLVSCLKSPEVKIPDIEMPEIKVSDFELPKFEDPLKDMRVCDTKESEQPEVSDDVLADRLVVIDEIDTQDYEFTHCNGEVTKGRGPTKMLLQKISIATPEEIADLATSVKVHNHRTCHDSTVKVSDKTAVEVTLSDIGYKVDKSIEVKDGANVLTVTYLDAEGKAVGDKQVYLDVRVHRPEISGVRQIKSSQCEEKKQ
ncbi:hypothetical protein [Bdellovibrio sp. HCB209]|uniref:hypothetical protein n=1 Tax=Bdellovibrio sp. HCB209 TaxID=3394354 RepID=UPI0039B6BF1F